MARLVTFFKNFSWTLLQVFWVAFGFVLGVLLVSWIWVGLVGASTQGFSALATLNALGYVAATTVVVGGAWLIARESWAKTKQLLGLNRAKLSKFAKTLLIFLVYMVVAQIVYGLAVLLLGDYVNFNKQQDLGFAKDSLTSAYQYVLVFIMLVILPPLFEEILFRGYLLGRLQKRLAFWPSSIITSLVFGLVHFNWSVSVDTFVLSLFLCYLRKDSDSIWPAVFLHGLKNALAYFLLFILPLFGISLL